MSENFIENILDAGCKIAKHKKSEFLTASDLKIAMGKIIYWFLILREKLWSIRTHIIISIFHKNQIKRN